MFRDLTINHRTTFRGILVGPLAELIVPAPGLGPSLLKTANCLFGYSYLQKMITRIPIAYANSHGYCFCHVYSLVQVGI
jgi:hypothetical protein